MAIPIKSIPVIKSAEAASFLEKVAAGLLKRGTVDFDKQVKVAREILKKTKSRNKKPLDISL